MTIIHANWLNSSSGSLNIWAETSELSTGVKTRGRKKKSLKPHPFAAGISALKEAIGTLAGSVIAEAAQEGELILSLPTRADQPIASSPLVLDQPASQNGTVVLESWSVPVLVLDASLALDFLLTLPQQCGPNLTPGDSVRFWAEVSKLLLELITQQRFFPTVVPDAKAPGQYRAQWTVYLSETDFNRVDVAARSMPPICRAIAGDKSGPVPFKLVLDFMNQTMDRYLREQLQTPGFYRQQKRTRQKSPTPVEAWLSALSSADARLSLDAVESKTFLQQLASWLEPIRPSAAVTPFRACFRLEAPNESETGTDQWQVTFHLQATDDRSLIIPAEMIWTRASSEITFLKRKFENPQERLLADLARAARVFPAIETSLRSARPSRIILNTQSAYHFLRQTALLLEQSGFGILLPSWWRKPALRLGVKLLVQPGAAVSNQGQSVMGFDSIVNYNWQVALGDEILSPDEFRNLAQLKIPLVQVRGQWVELKPEEIEKALEYFKKYQSTGTLTLREVLHLGLTGDTSETGLKIVGLETEGWIKDMFDALTDNAQIAHLPPPAEFCGELRPYQVRGFSWLAFLKKYRLGACLADDMGLGKTIQYLAFHLHYRQELPKSGPALIICPMSVLGNWHKEIQRFAPALRVLIHHGGERLSGKAFARSAKKHDIVLSTYALAHRDQELFSQVQWDHLVLDEAQNIKNAATKQTQAVRQLKANFRLALTGTPVENRLSELWSIMEFLNSGYLGTAQAFRQRFAIPIERYRNQEQAQVLRSLIQPFILRRLKTDPTIIQDLPEKNEMKTYCHLTAEQASLYEAVVQEMLEKIANSEGITRKGLVLATLTKLKQVCNHPAQFLQDASELAERSGKLQRIREMLEELLAENGKALIFTQFSEMGSLLRQDLQAHLGLPVLFLHGGTPKKQRDEMVQRFQSDEGPPIFILSLKAGGVGLNLTAANHVFHFDRWWNPAVENQATDRAFRIGQKRNVQVYKLVCLGTLEERIDQMIENKKELAENVVGTGEGWLTELSTDQLRELFTLNRENVSEE